MSAETLPRIVILQSNYNDNYLHYIDNPKTPKFLQFAGDYSYGLKTRFEVEPAKTHGGLFHIRSMHNNKYWSTQGQFDHWISANAEKPEEDLSKWFCTLFQPVFLNNSDDMTVRLRHVKTGHYAYLMGADPPHSDCLYAAFPYIDNDKRDVFTVIDWESVVVLPNRIVIKVNINEYLRTLRYGWLYTKIMTEKYAECDVFPSRNGGIRLKDVAFDRYWRTVDKDPIRPWVLADCIDPNIHSTDTVFIPVKLDDNVVALRCLRNNLYCRIYNRLYLIFCLAAGSTYMDQHTRMVVEEPILSRKIDNVKFHLTNARIYSERVLMLINQEVTNRTKEVNTMTVDLRYADTQRSIWTASVSLKLGVKASIRCGIPFLAESKIDVSGELNGSYQWGETVEKKIEVGSVYVVTVPPMSRVKVGLMATQGSCDIPFSYAQHDVLTNGSTKVYDKDDGLFKGQNSYNYKYETVQSEL